MILTRKEKPKNNLRSRKNLDKYDILRMTTTKVGFEYIFYDWGRDECFYELKHIIVVVLVTSTSELNVPHQVVVSFINHHSVDAATASSLLKGVRWISGFR